MKKFFLLFFLTAFLLLPTSTQASTSISDTISSNTTWTLSGSPYILERTIYVDAGATLTIEAGVVVKGRNGGAGYLVVNGALSAIGTSDSKIIFTSLLDDAVMGDDSPLDP